MAYIKIILSSLIFLIFSAWIISEMTGGSYILLNPITLTLIVAELLVAIVSPEISILGSNVGQTPKRVALGLFFGTTLFTTAFDLLFNSLPVVYGIIAVPVYIALGFGLIEAGRG